MPEYASTQINLPDSLAIQVVRAALKIEPRLELEVLPHLTVLYGLESDDQGPVRWLMQGTPACEVRLGLVDCFQGVENGTADAVFVRAEGQGLDHLRAKLERLPHLDQARAYVPHVTLAYVPPGTGKNWVGQALPFFGARFVADELIFSTRNRHMHHVPLQASVLFPAGPPRASVSPYMLAYQGGARA